MPRLVVVGVALLALASAVLVWLVPRWVELPGDVLADPGFATLGTASPTTVWQPIGNGRIEPIEGGVRLVNRQPEAIVGLDQPIAIPFGAQAFRVTATVTLRGVVAGPEPWQRPYLGVRGVTADGRAPADWRLPLIDRVGDLGPVRLSAVFPVASPIDEARVMLRLFAATGEMEIRDLEVAAAVRHAARDWLRPGLVTLWLTIGAAIGLALWRQSENRLAASLVLGGLAALALMVVLPQAIRQPMHDLLAMLARGRRFNALILLLHLGGFAVLAFASRLALPRWPLWLFVSGWLAAAVLLELAEFFFSQFDAGDLVDMACNAAGAGLGLAAAGLVLRRQRERAGAPVPAAWSRARRRP